MSFYIDISLKFSSKLKQKTFLWHLTSILYLRMRWLHLKRGIWDLKDTQVEMQIKVSPHIFTNSLFEAFYKWVINKWQLFKWNSFCDPVFCRKSQPWYGSAECDRNTGSVCVTLIFCNNFQCSALDKKLYIIFCVVVVFSERQVMEEVNVPESSSFYVTDPGQGLGWIGCWSKLVVQCLKN